MRKCIFLLFVFMFLVSPILASEDLAPQFEKWDMVANWTGYGVYCQYGLDGRWERLLWHDVNLFALGDLDGDSLQDLIYYRDNQLWVRYRGHGMDNQIYIAAGQLYSLTCGDLNGDQRADIIGSWQAGIFWRDSASGVWQEILNIKADMLAAGDFDDDGLIDIVGYWPQTGVWIRYSGDQRWERLWSDSAIQLASLGTGDMNGDGRCDLILNCSIGVWKRDIIKGDWEQLHPEKALLITTGDFDGDGMADLGGVWSAYPGLWVRYSQSGAYRRLHDLSPSYISAGVIDHSPVPGNYEFLSLKKMPYIGGSLICQESDPANSHLQHLQKYPVRFSAYDLVSEPDPNAPMKYQEKADSVKFGILEIDRLSGSDIAFLLKMWDYQGNPLADQTISLALGQGADVTGDGQNDIEYVAVIREDAASCRAVSFLRFISSQEKRYASMFCYAPDIFLTMNPMGGNFGYNPAGHALFRKSYMDAIPVAGRTNCLVLNRRLTPQYIAPGDFVINTDGAYVDYAKVETVDYQTGKVQLHSGPAAREEMQSLALEAFPIMSLDFTSALPAFPTKHSGDSRDAEWDEYQAQRQQCYNLFNSCDVILPIVDLSFMNDIKASNKVVGRAGVEKLYFGVGLGVKARTFFVGVECETKAMVLGEGSLLFEAFEAFSAETNLWKKDVKKSWPIVIGPIHLTVELGAEAGVDAGLKATDQGNIRVAVTELRGSRDYFEGYIRIGIPPWKFNYKHLESYDISAKYLGFNFACTEEISAFLKPYVVVWAKASLWGIAYAKLSANTFLKPNLTLKLNQDYMLLGDFKLDAGAGVDFEAGVKLLDYDLLHGSWNIFTWNKTLWQYTFQIPTKDQPNLFVSELEVVSAAAGNRQPVKIRATVKNRGPQPTPAGSDVHAAIYVDNQYAGGFFVEKNGQHAPLGVQESYAGLVEWNPTSGTHQIRVVVDDGNLIAEWNENDNTLEKNYGPDLIIQDIWLDPINPAPDDKVRIQARVFNRGTSDTPAGVEIGVGFKIDGQPAGCFFVEDANGQKIPLKAGEWYNGVCGPLWTAIPGKHIIEACADDVNRIPEIDETNNCLQEEYDLTPRLPDVYMQDIWLEPVNPVPGDQVKIHARIANKADAGQTPAGVDVGVGITVDGQYLGCFFVEDPATGLKVPMKPGEWYNGICNVIWTATAGEHTVGACADDVNRFEESNETNNCLYEEFEITVNYLPDVIIQDIWLDPVSPAPGIPTRILARIANVGQAATPAGVEVGVGIMVDGQYLGCFFVEDLLTGLKIPLKSGEWYNGICNVKWTAGAGKHTIGACADDVNRFPESKENNNCAEREFDISSRAPSNVVTSNPDTK